ncbi:MAG TPA: ATP-binding protein [Stellaceae bacterium]|jgi:signal transduction histidine kinase|nr:ATP-binding protein [Stellaceae bacterium]
MIFGSVARQTVEMRRRARGVGIRPVALLTVFAIILTTSILIATGIGANQLRSEALSTAKNELGRIDGVLAAAADRSFHTIDDSLGEIVVPLQKAVSAGAATLPAAISAAETAAALSLRVNRFPHVDAVAVIAASGEIVASAGTWPTIGNSWANLVAPPPSPGQTTAIGAPIRSGIANGGDDIPFAHWIRDASGKTIGAVVALVPASDFSTLFAAVSLTDDAGIVLFRRDGTVLARHLGSHGAAVPLTDPEQLNRVFSDSAETIARHVATDNGGWRIDAVRALASYPAAILVSRSAEQALAAWTRQGMWFSGCALAAALAIGVMVYLVAHQFEVHAAFTTVRTEKAEIDRARLSAEAELLKNERLSVLGQLTATVAHELRNPLSAIRNTLFTVKELAAGSGARLDRPIARMERSIERCDRIISDLLEYTRSRDLRLSDVNFDRWISDVLADQTVPAAARLSVETGAGDVVIAIDADRMRRVVINLVENAAQAMSDMAPDRERLIAVRTRSDGGRLIVNIDDTGPGISPDNLARIFEPLFSTKSFGTGLGLPTVKQIVNQHGGTIAIDSAIGDGAHVTVSLPIPPTKVSEKAALAA